MNELCGAFMPSNMAVTCRLKPGNHPEHLGGYAPDVFMWPNETYIAPSSGDSVSIAAKMAAQIPSMKVVPEISPYLNDDVAPQAQRR